MSDPIVLGVETSCDETGVAVVRGDEVLSNVLSSQVEAHARFGGVVPEVAARAHVEAIRALTHRALARAGVHPMDLDAVAATRGPGLAGALMVGFSYGKALAWAMSKPFLGIDHMEGHLFAPRLEGPDYRPPAVVLLASGGHSQIVHMPDWGVYEVMGSTIDDAAGEAFDKLARFLGMGFPGGPAIDRAAEGGNPKAVRFPRALPDRPFDFSFSGLKTSVTTYRAHPPPGRHPAAHGRPGGLVAGGHRGRPGGEDPERRRGHRGHDHRGRGRGAGQPAPAGPPRRGGGAAGAHPAPALADPVHRQRGDGGLRRGVPLPPGGAHPSGGGGGFLAAPGGLTFPDPV